MTIRTENEEVWWADTSPDSYGVRHGTVRVVIDDMVIVGDDAGKTLVFYMWPFGANCTEGTYGHYLKASDLCSSEEEAQSDLFDPFTATFNQDSEPGMWWWGEKEEKDADEI